MPYTRTYEDLITQTVIYAPLLDWMGTMDKFETVIVELAKPVNGYRYRVDVERNDIVRFSVYAENDNQVKELVSYYETAHLKYAR